jgi:hypothetical protein
MLMYFMTIWYILRPFDIFGFYGHLVGFSRFGMLYQEKSGNPGLQTRSHFYSFSPRMALHLKRRGLLLHKY